MAKQSSPSQFDRHLWIKLLYTVCCPTTVSYGKKQNKTKKNITKKKTNKQTNINKKQIQNETKRKTKTNKQNRKKNHKTNKNILTKKK